MEVDFTPCLNHVEKSSSQNGAIHIVDATIVGGYNHPFEFHQGVLCCRLRV